MIHQSAIIHQTARIGENVTIGPWSVIGQDVEIGDGTWIGPHVVIDGSTKIGQDNKIYQFASIGADPQDKKFQNEKTYLEIGNRNVIREFCTFNRGTAQDKSITRIGDDNLFMAYVHIAHDCIVGNGTIFANNASLAGHVVVDDHVIFGAFSGVFQFCRIGKYSFASMGALIDKDVPPFVKVFGTPAEAAGINLVGLQRRGFSAETVLNIKRAYRLIYRKGLTVKNALIELQAMIAECPDIQMFIDFIQSSERGIVR